MSALRDLEGYSTAWEESGADSEDTVLQAPRRRSFAQRRSSLVTPTARRAAPVSEVMNALSSDEEAREPLAPRRRASYAMEGRDREIYKWKLRFSGDDPQVSLEAFLASVEDKRISRRVSERDLFAGVADLLEGTALQWYRNRRSEFHSWGEFVHSLRSSFQDPNYNENLLDEIRRRTQAPGERAVHYITKMEGLYSRLTLPVSEADKLRVISRNVSPEFQLPLQTMRYRTVRELEACLHRLEVGVDELMSQRLPARHVTLPHGRKTPCVLSRWSLGIREETDSITPKWPKCIPYPSPPDEIFPW
ncbi:hypothetical protein M8J77_001524 [Diaphorina citri]|nr:hypothetical protein M8J77_001524 [Diaphorina citri]